MIRALAFIATLLLANAAIAAKTLPDIAYGTDPLQKMDVYLPDRPAKKMPIIVMVHGGAWRVGDKHDQASITYKVPHYTAKNYVFISLNYRLGNSSPLHQMADVETALAYIEANAQSWDADPSRIVIMGHSSGGHVLSLNAAVPPQLKYPLKGIVLIDTAGFDISRVMAAPHAGFYDPVFGTDPAVWEVNSPMHHLSQKTVPLLVICSTTSGLCQYSKEFGERAVKLGSRVERIETAKDHDSTNMDIGKDAEFTASVDRFIQSVF